MFTEIFVGRNLSLIIDGDSVALKNYAGSTKRPNGMSHYYEVKKPRNFLSVAWANNWICTDAYATGQAALNHSLYM